MSVKKCVLVIIGVIVIANEINSYKIVLMRTNFVGNKNFPFHVYTVKNAPKIVFPSSKVKTRGSWPVSDFFMNKNISNGNQNVNGGRDAINLSPNENILNSGRNEAIEIEPDNLSKTIHISNSDKNGIIVTVKTSLSKDKNIFNRNQNGITVTDKISSPKKRNIGESEKNKIIESQREKSLRTNLKKIKEDRNPTVIGLKHPNKMVYTELKSKHFYDKTKAILRFNKTFKYRNPEFYFPPNKLRRMRKEKMVGILPSSEMGKKPSESKVEIFFRNLLQKARAKRKSEKVQKTKMRKTVKTWIRRSEKGRENKNKNKTP